jgi:hypothetical protein
MSPSPRYNMCPDPQVPERLGHRELVAYRRRKLQGPVQRQ